MKNTIMKSMVALLLLWGTAACTDEVLVDMEKPGIENNSPEAGRITSLKNILPDAKPGYQGVDSRTETPTAWNRGDELLLKIQIKDGAAEKYTAWMTLLFDGTNWNIKSTTTGEGDVAVTSYAYYAQKAGGSIQNYNSLPLVTPASGFTLSGTENIQAIIPEEITSPTLNVTLMYAPDMKWDVNEATVPAEGDATTTSSIVLKLKENASTNAPEYWEVIAKSNSTSAEDSNNEVEGQSEETVTYVWDTSLARVCVKTGTAGDIVTLTSNAFNPSSRNKASENKYTATSVGTDGIAYFYGTIGNQTPVACDFKISLSKIMMEKQVTATQAEGDESGASSAVMELTDVFIPTTLFEASTLNKVTLEAGKSYLLDGTKERTQAWNDSKGAVWSSDMTNSYVLKDEGSTHTMMFPKSMTVYGVKGLLEYVGLLNRNDGFAEIDLKIANDIVLPQLELKSEKNTDTGISTYKYVEPISENWSNWVQISGEFGGSIAPVSDKETITISGLRLKDISAFVNNLKTKEGGDEASIKNLVFVDAVVQREGNAAVIVCTNEGEVEGCTVANSEVRGAGDVGAVVATNKGTVSNCHNISTDVIAGKANTRASELVGGVVGQNYGEKSIANDRKQGIVTNCTNSGKVKSSGKTGNNFTGGIVGHSYGIVSYCTNTGDVEGSTDGTGYNVTTTDTNGTETKDDATYTYTAESSKPYYTSVGGVVGNCSFGSIIACVNEGKVKSNTNLTASTNHNRVGGVAGYSGTNTNVVACANIGSVEVIEVEKNSNHVGGIVGHLYHSYKYDSEKPKETVENSNPGKVYASWTKKTSEIGGAEAIANDGIGDIDDKDEDKTTTGVFQTRVFYDKTSVIASDVTNMNSAIANYNIIQNLKEYEKCSVIWSLTSGSWPKLEPKTNNNQ